MPGLLDYVKGYTHGGGVDFDPYADTTQADLLVRFGIDVDADSTGLLPTYDSTGADLAREAYRLRSGATRGQATGSLLDLTRETALKTGGAGFKKIGGGEQAYQDVRGDVITGFGETAEQQYLDLQRDISGIQRGYEQELVSAVGDLPEESWRFRGDLDDSTYIPEPGETCADKGFQECDNGECVESLSDCEGG